MRITNDLSLPQSIVDAVRNDGYSNDGADISVTGLLRPPRIAALERIHAEELEEDASSRIWSLFGQAMHTVLERSEKTAIAERRLSVEVNGWRVSGQMDRYLDGVIEDYKFVTAYKFKGGRVPEEYEQQLNCYAHILRENGHPVTGLRLVGILRDWSKMEASRDSEYPQKQVVVVPVNLWPPDLARQFMHERIIMHQSARENIPLCSDADRWTKSSVWAVMQKGKVRALKLHGLEEDAKVHAAAVPGGYVEHRPGQSVRCEFYCSVSRFCDQFKQTKGMISCNS